MRVHVLTMGDPVMNGWRTFDAEGWMFDDFQNLLIRKDNSTIAMVSSDRWVMVEMREPREDHS